MEDFSICHTKKRSAIYPMLELSTSALCVEEFKLYMTYSPSERRDGTVRRTKADALLKPEEFDGKTTE